MWVCACGGCSAVERVLDCRRSSSSSNGNDGVGISGGGCDSNGGDGSDALLWQRHSTCQRRVLAAIFACATHICTVDIQHPRSTERTPSSPPPPPGARSLTFRLTPCGAGSGVLGWSDNTGGCGIFARSARITFGFWRMNVLCVIDFRIAQRKCWKAGGNTNKSNSKCNVIRKKNTNLMHPVYHQLIVSMTTFDSIPHYIH